MAWNAVPWFRLSAIPRAALPEGFCGWTVNSAGKQPCGVL
jgi:hypothetical protein